MGDSEYSLKSFILDVPIKEAPSKEAKFPSRLSKAIVVALASKPGFPAGWAYDGNKNIFTAEPLRKQLLNCPMAVQIEDEDSGRKRSFQV